MFIQGVALLALFSVYVRVGSHAVDDAFVVAQALLTYAVGFFSLWGFVIV